MWHASAAPSSGLLFGRTLLHAAAHAALKGVGDSRLGEWHEWTGRAYHIRRRLAAGEAARVGPVVDIRGTPEAARRLEPVRAILPEGWGE